MSSTIVLGAIVPKHLPITGTYAVPFAAYYTLLSSRVVRERLNTSTYHGENEPGSPLQLFQRSYANFLESVPLTLLFAGVAELNGADRKVLNWLLATYFALRVVHVEFGLRGKDSQGRAGVGWGRTVGYFGSMATTVGLGGWCTYLCKEWWGF